MRVKSFRYSPMYPLTCPRGDNQESLLPRVWGTVTCKISSIERIFIQSVEGDYLGKVADPMSGPAKFPESQRVIGIQNGDCPQFTSR